MSMKSIGDLFALKSTDMLWINILGIVKTAECADRKNEICYKITALIEVNSS